MKALGIYQDEPQERYNAFKNMLWILRAGVRPDVKLWNAYHLKRFVEARRKQRRAGR